MPHAHNGHIYLGLGSFFPFFPRPSLRMSGRSFSTSKSHTFSRFSRFQKHVSSIFSRSPPDSAHPHSPLRGDNTGRVEVPDHHIDTHLSLPSASHRSSVSSVYEHCTANSMPAYRIPSPQRPSPHLEDLAYQDYASTHLAPPSAPPLPQGQASTFQGSSVSAALKLKHSLTSMPALVWWSSQFRDE
jgi:hypothetical protein